MTNQHPLKEIIRLMESAESKLAKARLKKYGQHGITSSQISILMLLNREGPMKINQIAEALKMIQSNASNICSRLEKAGLVQRKRCDRDQRAVYTSLTEEAQIRMKEINKSVDHFHQLLAEKMSPQDLADIHNGLVKLNELFDLYSLSDSQENYGDLI